MYRLVWSLFLVTFVNACAGLSSPPEATLVSTQAESQIVPTLASSTVVPAIEQLCPQQQEVTLTELGLDPETRLLVQPGQSQTAELWTISGVDWLPKVIPATQSPVGWHYSFHGLSPDGQWLLFHKSSSGTDTQEHLWLMSVDGRELHDILSFTYQEGVLSIQPENSDPAWTISNVDYGFIYYWSGQDEITIEARLIHTPSLDPTYPVFRVNPFTLEGQAVFTSEEVAGWNLGIRLGPNYEHNGITYEIYKGAFSTESTSGFFLYDRNGVTSQPVFQWLNNEDWITWDYATLTGFRYWQDKSGLESMVIIQPYGFDLATALDFATLTHARDYNAVMEPVIMPPGEGHLGEFRSPNLVVGWISPDGSRFALERKSHDESNPFYIFDLSSQILRDYCRLPRNEGSSIYSSPDGRWLSWSVNVWDEEDRYLGMKETVILEITTGRFTRIPDFAILGWSISTT